MIDGSRGSEGWGLGANRVLAVSFVDLGQINVFVMSFFGNIRVFQVRMAFKARLGIVDN